MLLKITEASAALEYIMEMLGQCSAFVCTVLLYFLSRDGKKTSERKHFSSFCRDFKDVSLYI